MQSPVNTAPEPGGAGSGSSALSCGPPYAIVTVPTAVVSHGILNHPALWTGTGKLSFGFPSSPFFFFLTSSICGESDIGTDSSPVPLALAAYTSMRSRGAPHIARRPSGISRLPFKPLKTLLNSEANEFTQILTQYILLLIHLRSDLILLPKGTKMLGKI